MEQPMMKIIFAAGILATAMVATPVLAQEATQEPGAMGFYYPDSHYLTGGYGAHATPRPYYYARPHAMGEQGALPAYGPAYGGPDYY
jgi:hypothetical protein